MIKFEQQDTVLYLFFGYNPDINEIIKKVPGYVYHASTKTWSIPAREIGTLTRMLDECGFPYDADQARQVRVCRRTHEEIRDLLLAGDAVVFDIETYEAVPSNDGRVDPLKHAIVCASVAFREKDGNRDWQVKQWFAETPEDEGRVCEEVARFLGQFEIVLTYNGDHFDIPCFNRRLRVHGVEGIVEPERHFDLMTLVLPARERGWIPNAKLKTVEQALGIQRIDEIPGSAVVRMYQEYQETREARLKELILGHNLEDVLYLARDIAPQLLNGFEPKMAAKINDAEQDVVAKLVDEFIHWHAVQVQAKAKLEEIRERILERVQSPGAIEGRSGTLVLSLREDVNTTVAEKMLADDGLLEQYQQPRLDKKKVREDIVAGKLPETYRQVLETRAEVRVVTKEEG